MIKCYVDVAVRFDYMNCMDSTYLDIRYVESNEWLPNLTVVMGFSKTEYNQGLSKNRSHIKNLCEKGIL